MFWTIWVKILKRTECVCLKVGERRESFDSWHQLSSKNVSVQREKCICPNCKMYFYPKYEMYFSILPKIFVQVSKCVCLNKMCVLKVGERRKSFDMWHQLNWKIAQTSADASNRTEPEQSLTLNKFSPHNWNNCINCIEAGPFSTIANNEREWSLGITENDKIQKDL